MKKQVITLIPARGGSKGVPNKNSRLLAGKPLLAYTVLAALHSGVVDRVYVSTDDEAIARIARDYGAEVIDRPKELAGDKVTLEPVIAHALTVLEKEMKYVPDYISLIQPTSPLLKPEVIAQCVKKVVQEGYDSCITAFVSDTYEWKWRPVVDAKSGEEIDFQPEVPVLKRVVRQDLPKLYHENGAFYVTKMEHFKKYGHRWGGRMAIVEMTPEDSIQIDAPDQFWFIEQIIKKRELQSEAVSERKEK